MRSNLLPPSTTHYQPLFSHLQNPALNIQQSVSKAIVTTFFDCCYIFIMISPLAFMWHFLSILKQHTDIAAHHFTHCSTELQTSVMGFK